MLHIILGILKIIGMIVGFLLLLLLTVALALIFVPVRYRLTAVRDSDRLEASLRASWLLHLVSAAAKADPSGGRTIVVRLFGIALPLFRPSGGTGKHSAGNARKSETGTSEGAEPEETVSGEEARSPGEDVFGEEVRPPGEAVSGEEARSSGENVSGEEVRLPGEDVSEEKTRPQGEAVSGEEARSSGEVEEVREEEKPGNSSGEPRRRENSGMPDAEETEPPGAEEETDVPPKLNIIEKTEFQCRRIYGKIKEIIRKIQRLRQTLAGFGRRLARLWKKAAELLQKPGRLLEFLEEYEAAEIFGSLTGYLVFLAGHYKPRKIQGYLRFGTGDPALTGQLTGLVYLLLPAGADQFTVTPEFYEKLFETEIICSGHIRAIHVLRVLLRAFRDKKLRRLIGKLRKRGES